MVWNQYVWEATTGNEVEWSDDEDGGGRQETLLVDDWLDYNADELGYMWGIVCAHVYDTMRNPWPAMTREALGRFCFDQYTYDPRSFEAAHWIDRHADTVSDLWRKLRPHVMRKRVAYEEFAHFCYAHR